MKNHHTSPPSPPPTWWWWTPAMNDTIAYPSLHPHISQRELWISACHKTMMKWLLSMSTDYDHICPHILLTWFWLYRFHIVLLTVFYIAAKPFYLRTKGKQTNEMCMVRMVFCHRSLERFWMESNAEFKSKMVEG